MYFIGDKRSLSLSLSLIFSLLLLNVSNGQTCTNISGSLSSRFDAPNTDVVCLNISTATCPSGVEYFGIDYDCSVASQGAERCFCTSDDR